MSSLRRSLVQVPWRIALPVIVALASTSCGADPAPDLDAHLAHVTRDSRFSIWRWEAQRLFGRDGPSPRNAGDLDVAGPPGEDGEPLVEYTRLVSQVDALRRQLDRAVAQGDRDETLRLQAEIGRLQAHTEFLREAAQRALAHRIRAVSANAGIHNPLDRWVSVPVTFPPVWIELGDPPHSLIVSRRERIETVREVLLDPHLTVEEMERIEAQVEELGYSALVVGLGGFGGLYPALVASSSSVPWLVETATEEWLHQYLTFTPIGFTYVLHLSGIRRYYPVSVMNETVAGIVSDELGREVLVAYYPEYLSGEEEPRPPPEEDEEGFSFDREMRQTRLRVDEFLAEGRVEEAEEYMEQRRRAFVDNGYYIRKLNQAYYAFHGAYADEPSSVDPIGEQMKALRAHSASLGDFLRRAVVLTSPQELEELVGREP